MEIAFTKVALPFGWLGNMSPHQIVTPPGLLNGFDGMTFRTGEALFQAMRFTNRDIIISIWREKSPMAAKMVAKRHVKEMVIAPRSKEDTDNMFKVLCLKIDQHPKLREELLSTGDAEIIEDCSNRRNDSGLFWGAAKVDGVWVGRNKLGRLWWHVRNFCKTDQDLKDFTWMSEWDELEKQWEKHRDSQ